jgi:signal transduction histidine kinase/ActR/RegA family two-component response regulator
MKFLNIEDSEEDYQLILAFLRRGGYTDITSKRVETAEQLRQALKEDVWDIVLSDYNIPGFDPLQALSIVREYQDHIPFIVVSGQVGEESVATMMKNGVEDFVLKTRMEKIVPVVRRALREKEIEHRELKASEAANKALSAKEEMLQIVSHDIKNPLAAIQLDAQMLELLSHKNPTNEVMRDLRVQSKRILRTVNRLKELVSNLLQQNAVPQDTVENDGPSFALHRDEQNPLHVLNEVLDVFKPLIQEKNLSIKKEVVQRKMIAYFDKDRIHQVLSNLLGNALKFTPIGGEIKLKLEEDAAGNNVFTIVDSGPGFSKKDSEHLFDKFWTKGSGSGLGLFICKTIVEAHGGRIHASSEPGKGASFWFNLPPEEFENRKEDANEEIEKKYSQNNNTNIYVIDDDNELREVICWALEKEGYRVFSFNNAHSALQDLTHTFYPPHLVILDYHMDKMDGNEFLLQKKRRDYDTFKDAPVVMVTAAPKDVEKKVDADLYDEVLVKPLDLNKLIETVKHQVQ